MNGRIYDPKLGRFLQADPVVQAPKNSQNLNRYSYVLNNPLSYTDPTGFSFWKKIRSYVSIAVMIGGMIVAPELAPLWGGLSGFINSGTIKGAVIGAFSATVFQGIGRGFAKLAQSGKYASVAAQSALRAGKVLAHGIAGGVMSELNGGKFGHGFWAAGFTQAFAPAIDGIDLDNAGFSAGRTVAAAMVGGTASELSGGKFANGAVTGAFSRAFNDEIKHLEYKKFERALETQFDRVVKARSFNLEQRSKYSGSRIGSYIYSHDGHYTIEKYINPNQADIDAGNPQPGIFGGDPQKIPNNVAGLVIADRPFTDINSILSERDYFNRFFKSIRAPIFVIPHSRYVGDQIIRFDSGGCTYYPDGSSC